MLLQYVKIALANTAFGYTSCCISPSTMTIVLFDYCAIFCIALTICDPLSENLHSLHNLRFLFSQHYLQCLRSGYLKFQLNQASSFEFIALDSRVSKKIDLYSNHIKNKLQALTFAAITLIYNAGI